MPRVSPEAIERNRRVVRERKELRREQISQIKVGQGCKDCPPELRYSWPACALGFDHLDGSDKVADVSNMIGWAWERVAAEIDKCDVVCHNHHAIRTQARR